MTGVIPCQLVKEEVVSEISPGRPMRGLNDHELSDSFVVFLYDYRSKRHSYIGIHRLIDFSGDDLIKECEFHKRGFSRTSLFIYKVLYFLCTLLIFQNSPFKV